MADSEMELNEEKNGTLLPYRYLSLDNSHDEIRLLKIPRKLPGPSTPVKFMLSHIRLRDQCEFQALSYCWGDHVLNQVLNVNGHSMHVTESLGTALASLQSEHHDISLWADAICINQHDAIEKTSQVQLMRDIYQTASRVIIWLGPSNSDTYYTMREMRKLGDELLKAGLWDLSSDEILRWDLDDDNTSRAASTKHTILRMRAEHLAKARNDEYPFWWIMSDLGKRKWFHASHHSTIDQLAYLPWQRIWCIQECTNARIATFRCGNDEVDFTRLWAVALYFRIFSSRSHPDVNGDAEAFWKDNWLTNMLSDALPTTIIGIRRKHLVSGGHDLRTLLDRVIVKDSNSHRIDATDPRDRVFALLGISNDDAAKDIIADYTLSCEQAYIMTARVLLLHGHDDILSLCRQRGACINLPSWVPEWSTDLRKPWSVWHINERLYNASGAFSKLLGASTSPGSEEIFEPQLNLKGVFVDSINEIGHSFRVGFDDQIEWNKLRPYFDDIAQFLSRSGMYTAAQKEEAEWRIPVGDTEVAETNSQMIRATAKSHMKSGYAVAKAMSSEEGAADETVKQGFLPFACYRCQLSRMYDSRPFISKSGYVGLCPHESRPGDTIAIFKGARVPYIIRKSEISSRYTLIGESHVYGIMDGEFMSKSPVIEDITLF